MGNIVFGNYGSTFLTGSVAAVDTAITVNDASNFPTIAGGSGDFFLLTFVRASDNAVEIVKVTNVAANVITCVRAQESTTALALVANDNVQVWLTAGAFDNVVLKDSTGDAFIANDKWYKADNNAGTGFVNIAKVNTSDQLVFGGDVVDLAMVNDTYLKGRNFADSADIDMIKVNASDNLAFGAQVAGLNLTNNTYLTARNAADSADIDILKIDSSNLLQIGNAAAQVLFYSNSSEAMRINSSRQVGIGNTNPAYILDVLSGTVNTTRSSSITEITGANKTISTRSGTLMLNSNDGMAADAGGSLAFGGRWKTGDTSQYGFAVIKGAKESGTTAEAHGYWSVSTSNNAGSMMEGFRVDSSQRLLIDKTSPGTGFNGFEYDTPNTRLLLTTGNAVDQAAFLWANNASYTGDTLHLRTTRASSTAFNLILAETNASTSVFVVDGNGDVTNTNNSYGAISDEKLKQDFTKVSSQLDDVLALGGMVTKYRLKQDVIDNGDDAIVQIGMKAQDAETVSPGIVFETEDTVEQEVQFPVLDDDGNVTGEFETKMQKVLTGEVTKGIKYSLIPLKHLVAFKEYVEKTDARLEALEA